MKRLFLLIGIFLLLCGQVWGESVIASQTSHTSEAICNVTGVAQAFTYDGSGKKVTSGRIWLNRYGDVTGITGVMKIYEVTGTPGSNGKPDTGNLLATSESRSFTGLGLEVPEAVVFTFSGVNQIVLEDSHNYAVSFELSATTSGLYYGRTYLGDLPGQNFSYYSGGWGADASLDLYFVLYGENVGGPGDATISPATNVTQTTLTGVGSSTDGGGEVSARGIVGKYGGTPTVEDYDFILTSTGTSGDFAGSGMNATGLTANRAYTVRAFVTNEYGTAYSSASTYTTLRNVTTFYIGQGGTAATIAAATGATTGDWNTDKANFMSPATHNALSDIIPGDTIKISDKGGTYVPSGPQASIIIPPSDGGDGKPITYAKVPGETPTIDMRWTDNGSDWTPIGDGKYTKLYGGGKPGFYGVVVWEDGVALKIASDAAHVNGVDGDWNYYAGTMTYKPKSGTPADHDLKAIWQEGGFGSVFAVDLSERSFIDVSGLVINYGGIRIAQKKGSTATVLDGIKVHDCTFNYSPWAISGQVLFNDCVFQNAEFYNNIINYSNCGISVWTHSDETVHSQKPYRVKIYNNTINHHFSIDSVHNWDYASSYNPDHEAISFQDPVECEITNNTITLDNNPMYNYVRAIFIYTNPNADSVDNNLIAYNKITGGSDRTINFSGGCTSGQGNVIASNVINCAVSNGSMPENYAIYVSIPTNSASGMNYICNNTMYVPSTIGRGINIGTNSGKWTVKNNIINVPGGVNNYNVVAGATTKSDYVFSNNSYYLGGFHDGSQLVSWATWQGYGWDTDVLGSFNAVDPKLRASDLAITFLSPDGSGTGNVVSGGTPIDGITYSGETGLPGIDGQLYDVETPAMGAYAEPVASPTVATGAVSNISYTTATGNATMSGETGWTISENGVAVGESPNPTISGTHFNPSPADIVGAFSVPMTGLPVGTHLYARAFIVTELETIYGADEEFDTESAVVGGGLTLGIQGQNWPGPQRWK